MEINRLNRERRLQQFKPPSPGGPRFPGMPPPPGRRHYMPGLGRFLTRARLEQQVGDEGMYAYCVDNPTTYLDPSGDGPTTRSCKPGGTNRRKPPDRSKCGPGCLAVYLTCNPNHTGRTAVYCKPTDTCVDTHGKPICCAKLCNQQGEPLGPPVFPRGTCVCIHGIHGKQTRCINDCGCGQKAGNKPQADNWMDIEIGGSCSRFKDGWRCVCPGKSKK